LKPDHENIELIKAGSTQALALIYDQYSPQLYTKILSMVKDVEIAKELLQDVFLKIWNNRERIDTGQAFKSWMYTIAVNMVYDYYRKLSRDTKMQQDLLQHFAELYYTTDNDFIDGRRDILDKALAELPPQRLAVFKMCKIEGVSYQEAAEKLGISPSTVSNHLVKATKTVKEYIFNSKELLILLISYHFGR
jgi:RNA polymerase sigma-70 factor (family 1)